MSGIAILVLGSVAVIYDYRLRNAPSPKSRLISRIGSCPSPVQFNVARQMLECERDRIDAYQSQCYREHLARCARKSQHQFLTV